MPIYDYQCTQCSHKFEVRRAFHDTSAVLCPKCGGEGKRQFSTVPIFFKGSGFYSTDKQKKSWWQKPGMDECMADAKSDLDKALGNS